MSIFFEIHDGIPREGPGDDASTLRAYRMLSGLPENPRILDIGCGPGRQTIVLAQANPKAHITAIDINPPFLAQLKRSAAEARVEAQIDTRQMSMFGMDFKEQTFDVVWSEGAIYITGFQRGLQEWRRLIKPGGYLAVTEITWLKPNPPEEIRLFWEGEYSEMRTADKKSRTIEQSGYRVIDHFPLPKSAWWDQYYTPLEQKLPGLIQKYKNDPEALAVIDGTRQEIELYRKYCEWYSYYFYVCQRVD